MDERDHAPLDAEDAEMAAQLLDHIETLTRLLEHKGAAPINRPTFIASRLLASKLRAHAARLRRPTFSSQARNFFAWLRAELRP